MTVVVLRCSPMDRLRRAATTLAFAWLKREAERQIRAHTITPAHKQHGPITAKVIRTGQGW